VIPALFIIGICIAVLTISMHSRFRYLKNLKAEIANSFGKKPTNKENDLDSIGRYASHAPCHDLRIDSITWNDLGMDSIFKRINSCHCSVGEEYLYNCLHELQFDDKPLLKREELIKFYETHPKERFDVQFTLATLGITNHNGFPALIYKPETKQLPRPHLYIVLAIMPLLFAASLVVSLPIGIAGLILSFIANVITHYWAIKRVDSELYTIDYFISMMKCVKKLYAIEGLSKLPIMQELRTSYDTFHKITRKTPVTKAAMGADVNEGMRIYANIAFLIDVRRYNKFIKLIARHNREFHQIYRAIGELDTAQAILSFRKSLPISSTPLFRDTNALDFEEVYHPLVDNSVTNSHAFHKNSLITGANATGKSTFIKALAINGILAQTIYTCAARRFATRFAIVITSMAMRDDLLGGESYFVVEVKSLKRILDMVAKYPCICYIDEILRGTNTVERIAASTAILTHLNSRDTLCIVASHDIELTRLLASCHDNYHFSEQVTDDGITFDYKLKIGPTKTRNAIKLLEFMDFDSEIVKNANEIANK